MPYPRVVRIAHRGASAWAPENTLPAFEKALEIGVDAVEMDVHMTRDRQIVVMHDADVRRTTDGEGRIQQMDLAEIRTLDAGRWFSPEFEGIGVPTLLEVLDGIRGRCLAVVEIKQSGIASEVIEAVRQARMEDDVLFISFLEDVLLDLGRLDGMIPRGLLIGGATSQGDRRMEALKRVRQVLRVGACLLDIHHGVIDPAFAWEVKRRGLALWTWTVDEPERMRTLIDLEIGGITTNHPERLNACLREGA